MKALGGREAPCGVHQRHVGHVVYHLIGAHENGEHQRHVGHVVFHLEEKERAVPSLNVLLVNALDEAEVGQGGPP